MENIMETESGEMSAMSVPNLQISARHSSRLIASPSGEWGEKRSTVSLKGSVSSKTGKSTTKLEEKFRRYVSEGDLLMRQLDAASDDVSIIENFCDSAHLLEKNTESFKCLAQLLLSSSSLAKNRLFLFPPLEDPGISVAFNFEEPVLESDDIGVEKYKKLCREMEIVPIRRIIDSLQTDTLNLKYYGLTNKQIRALTEALKANAHVQTLSLQDNWLSVEMVQMVSDMLVENMALQYLSLRECRIGEEGAQKLGEVLSSLQTLRSLDLSFNDLGDSGLLALRDGLCGNTSLKKLNISHNNITEDSAENMEKILLENKSIEHLDLSWNGFFTAQGNRKLFSGFMHSDRIKNLNLAWNGIGIVPAVRPLTRYITKSQQLEDLDLSNNRLVGQSLRMVRTAVNKNHSLQCLKIGSNIYAPEEAHFLLTMLAGKAKDPLFYLDMENMYIKKESKAVLNKIRNIGKIAKIGGILSDYEIHGPNPRKLIYERCRYILTKPKKAKARKDFGHFILSLPDQPVSPEDFQKELKKQKIKKLDKDLIQGLMNLFMNKKKLVDCPELVHDYMTFYPETQLPPPKPKKGKKGGKKGKKRKGKDTAREEKEVKVHNLETEGQVPGTEDAQAIDKSRQSRLSKRESASATGAVPRSSANVLRFSASVPRSSATVPRSSAEVPRSSAEDPRSSATVPRPSATVPRSSASVPRSSAAVPRPSATAPRSSAAVPRPSATVPRSSAAVGAPLPQDDVEEAQQMNID